MDQNIAPFIELGSWIGRGQAFGAISNHCSAAQAACFRAIRDNHSYKSLDLTWDDFCREYTGLSRQRVEAIIQNLEEFGETYFRLAQIARISPHAYRELAPAITGEGIEIDGETVPLTPENSRRIRAFIIRMRGSLKQSADAAATFSSPGIINFVSRADALFDDIDRAASRPLATQLEKAQLRGLIAYCGNHLQRLAKSIRE